MKTHKPQLIESKKTATKRIRRRKTDDPMPAISERVAGLALVTKSLKRVCEQLEIRESQAAWALALHAVEILHKRRDGFGMPIAKKLPTRELTVRDSRRFVVVNGKAAA